MNKNDDTSRDSGVLSNPLSFIHSGSFGWDFAGLNNRGTLGNYWSLRSASTTDSYRLLFSSSHLGPQNGAGGHGYGFAVRAQILHHSH